jgi:plasmid stabilization system protein ParE
MKTTVLWTPQAREDLLDIYVTIGFDNPASASAGRRLRHRRGFWWKACT